MFFDWKNYFNYEYWLKLFSFIKIRISNFLSNRNIILNCFITEISNPKDNFETYFIWLIYSQLFKWKVELKMTHDYNSSRNKKQILRLNICILF